MRTARRWVWLILPLGTALLLFAAYLLVDAWLESAGGRHALERALADKVGLPVRLEGEFNVMLLPAIGVTGTVLVLGEPGAATEFARSQEYAVSLALAPLLEGRMLIESVRFADGTMHLGRWPGRESSGADQPQAAIQLPEVGRLVIQDFKLVAAEGDDKPYLLSELNLEEFAAGRRSPLRLKIRDLGAWVGSLSWNPERSELEVTAAGTGSWAGELQLRISALLDSATGTMDADWVAPQAHDGAGDRVHLSLRYAVLAAGLRMDGIRFTAAPLLIEGDGCLLTAGRPALHLELVSERVNADALSELAALAGSGPEGQGEQPAAAWPGAESSGTMDFNVRLTAGELLAGGALARQAVLQLGGAPDCRMLDAATAD